MGTPKEAHQPTFRNFDFDSNVTGERDLHSAKHHSRETSTDQETMISMKPL
jgi:hypothetical protein